MLNFNYTLDNELEVPVGRLPTGIQTQALEMAIHRVGRRYRTTKKLLSKRVPGLGRGPVAGMSKDWQLRLISQAKFLDAIPSILYARAANMVQRHMRNAVLQGDARRVWNAWSDRAIQDYAKAVAAFEREVAAALTGETATGMPAAMIRLARTAGVPEPVVLDAKQVGLESLPEVDDPDYLAGVEAGPMFLGAIAGAAAVGLAAWWFGRPQAATAAMGSLGDEVDPYYGQPWTIGPKFTTQAPREPIQKCIRYKMTPRGRRCVQYRRMWVTPEGHRVRRPRPWKSDCPGCFPAQERFRRMVRRGR